MESWTFDLSVARPEAVEHGGPPELPVDVFRAAVDAVDDLVVRKVRDGGLAALREVEPVAVDVELAIFGLPEAAGPLGPGR